MDPTSDTMECQPKQGGKLRQSQITRNFRFESSRGIAIWEMHAVHAELIEGLGRSLFMGKECKDGEVQPETKQ